MLKRLANTLKLTEETNETKVDHTVSELKKAITKTSERLDEIDLKSAQVADRLQYYLTQYETKKSTAKKAISLGNKHIAQQILDDIQVVKQQYEQYLRLNKEISGTKIKLQKQKAEFEFALDQIDAKRALGEANADASQMNADIAKHLMLLDESSELSQYNEIIAEADSKYQAIAEIQATDKAIDNYLDENVQEDQLIDLETEIKEEREQKIKAALEANKKLFESTFGEDKVEVDNSYQKKSDLINQLKSVKPEKDKVEKFFTKEPSTNTQEEREKQDRINQFFNS